MFIIRLIYNWFLVLVLVPILGGIMLSGSFLIDAIRDARLRGLDSSCVNNEAKSLLRGSEWLRLG